MATQMRFGFGQLRRLPLVVFVLVYTIITRVFRQRDRLEF